jgi:hypothetical protein
MLPVVTSFTSLAFAWMAGDPETIFPGRGWA